jgi:site-specific DNA recombinase
VVLAQFERLWEFLNSREKAQIVRTLIEHIDYSGKTNRVTVSFRSRGVRGMCRGRESP